MNKFTRTILIALSTVFLTSMFINVLSSPAAAAFDKDYLMSDSVFDNKNSMSASQIDNFLNGFSRSCISPNSGFRAVKPTGYSPSSGFQYGEFTTAGNVIHAAAQAYDINPQVLLATLEKEQSLVTGRNSSSYCSPGNGQHKYAAAMGYGCPDSGGSYSYSGVSLYRRGGTTYTSVGPTCVNSSSKAGFSQQVIRGAWLLKFGQQRSQGRVNWAIVRGSWDNSDDPQSCYSGPMTQGTWRRCPSGSAVFYDGLRSIDNQTVKMGSGATAALYWYTPHLHGNKLFVSLFEDWFGSVTGVSVGIVRYDSTTDKTGEPAKVGFRLSHRPTHDVTLQYVVSSPSNAQIVGSSSVRITPSTWDKPRLNTISVAGINNPDLTGTFQYRLHASRPTSADIRYNSLSAEQVGHIPLVQLDAENPPNVYRLYNSALQQHYFTSSTIEKNNLTAAGWTDEGVMFHYCQAGEQTVYRVRRGDERQLVIEDSARLTQALSQGFSVEGISFAVSAQGTVPVYWRYDASRERHLYTTSPTEGLDAGFEDRGVAFYACQEEETQPIYRMYRPSTKSHFYTVSPSERDAALYGHGFSYEKLGFYVCRNGDVDIYRLYRPSTGNHFYTTSSNERDKAVNIHGFEYEGVTFKICNDADRDVYRLYNPTTKSHFYTTSSNERDKAVNIHGFEYEGVTFKVR